MRPDRVNHGQRMLIHHPAKVALQKVDGLGVPDALIHWGGFTFAAAIGGQRSDNPWTLLRSGEGVGDGDGVPAIADAETAHWILHKGLGDVITVEDEAGRTRRLRLVALLKASIFQGELLISQANFDQLFPSETGFKKVLCRVAPAKADAVKQRLETALAGSGLVVDRTADRLALFADVAGTYRTTFQTLGGLGLLLGTVGLVVVLLRGLVERRGELALMTVLGFRRGSVVRMVLAENGFLLVSGVVAGAVSALVAVIPQVASGANRANWPALVLMLAGIVAVGLIVLAVAVRVGCKSVTAADLRRE